MNVKTRYILEILAVVILFLFFSYLAQENIEFISNSIGSGIEGMFFYVLISIIEVVIAPISTLPLLPVAANLWGVVNAAVLSIIGWTFGAYLAFFIARKYGVVRVKKFVSMDKIENIERRIPDENIFWTIVLLRIIIPVDFLSYVLGLFSKIKTRDYILATIIGVTPFAFIFSYLGTIPIEYQIIGFLIVSILIMSGLIIKNKQKR